MITEKKKIIRDKIETLFNEDNPVFQQEEIKSIVSSYLNKRDYYLEKLKQNFPPCYLLETSILKKKADDFRHAFENLLPETAFYFAMKCNNHPEISSEMTKNGYGLDVSSGLELDQALALGCEDIVFSGPGKTKGEHYIALQNAGRVKILVDSFGELERLSNLANFMMVHVRIGVRLTTNPKMLWRKFGILPERLEEFYQKSRKS